MNCDWCERHVSKLVAKESEGVAVHLCEQCSNQFDKVNDAGVIKIYE